MKMIIGAGLSGLICGALNAQTRILERNKSDFVSHRAVLRFRDDKIAKALGLTFRKVTVRKGIYMDGANQPASIRLANMYSMKVRGVLTENSVWNLATSERFIAPEDLHAILADLCGTRINWGYEVTAQDLRQYHATRRAVVNTSPLPILLDMLGIVSELDFAHAPILVSRYRIADCDLHQTIYFPDPDHSVYRATLTGDLLTVERTEQIMMTYEDAMVAEAFGISEGMLRMWSGPIGGTPHRQSFGKIAPVPDGPRKSLLHRLTQDHGIYSLGRFGIWKNILLDDVYDDIAVVRRLMHANSYDVSVERTRG